MNKTPVMRACPDIDLRDPAAYKRAQELLENYVEQRKTAQARQEAWLAEVKRSAGCGPEAFTIKRLSCNILLLETALAARTHRLSRDNALLMANSDKSPTLMSGCYSAIQREIVGQINFLKSALTAAAPLSAN